MPPAPTPSTFSLKFFFLPILILGFFSVAPSAHAAMTVTAPSAGTSWQAGTTHTISWSGGGSWVTRIQLNTPTVGVLTIATNLSNTGSYSWTIPTSVAPATNYLIYVETATCNGCGASDWGYGPQFTITAPASNAAFISQTPPPSTMTTGQVATVSVTMQNTGGDTWTQAGSYRLGSQNTQDNTTWGSNRTNLPVASVAPGASATFTFTVTAPSTPGTYNFQRRMLQEGITWFGAYSTNVAVTVTAPDTTPPTVSITAPAGGSTVSGMATTVSVNASDNIGVVGVQFKVDGANIGAEDTTSPYSVSWNTTAVANGSHTLTAVARDAAGNSATSAGVSVMVNNIVPDTTPPSIPTGLSASAVSSSQINLSWSASTDTGGSGLAGYNVYRNGGGAAINTSLVTTTSYSDTGRTPSTSYSYTVEAQDGAGNKSAKSSPVSATTQAPPPLPNVSGYAWADDIIGWLKMSGTATDGSPYGVLVSSASPGVLSGYAWANPNDGAQNNIGWIDFGPTGSYPVSSFVPAQSSRMNRTTGLVSGWARACSVFASGCSGALKADSERGGWDGWIGFGTGGSYTQPVTVSGCNWSGYAWGGGTTIGWIHFGGALYPTTGSGDGCAALPDLTAGTVSPTLALTGTATTFSSTISNIGAGATGAGFTNLFQFDDNSDHAVIAGTMTDTSPAVAAGGTDVSQVSYTFSTAGTWYVRACADNNASFVGTITESNESNNCGAWTPMEVALPILAGTFSASPDTIDPGNPSTLTWTSNATSCVGVGFSTGGNANGNTIVTPTQTSPYQITCSRSGYEDLTLATTITVISVTASINAKPSCISGGGSSKVSWSASPESQIASCTISSNPTGPGFPITQSTPPFTGEPTATVSDSKYTFTIACTTDGGATVTKSTTVDVRSCWTEF